MKTWDNMHYNSRKIDGHNKPFNFIMSPREPGKTTFFWVKKIYKQWKKTGRPWYYMLRNITEISEALIESIQGTLNEFTDDGVQLKYKAGKLDSGIVDIFINDKIIFRIVALSCKLRKIKLAILPNAEGALMDEYIIDPQTGEKYLEGEAFKIKEAYTTWRRGYGGNNIFKMYFLANPYSLYNPLFVDWHVNTNQLKRGEILTGDIFAIEWAQLSPELRAHLLKVNPLFKFDEDYSKYALEGQAVQDANIKISPFPNGYKLQFVFKYDNIFIGIYRNMNYNENDKFYAKEVSQNLINRDIYCFDFADMIKGSVLIGLDERLRLRIFKDAVRTMSISFENVNLYYIIKEVYSQI